MANEQNLKPFTKGDPRINRKGRPKSFDKLRELAQSLSHEVVEGKDGSKHTAVEMILRKLATEKPDKFLEIAYGKVPQPVELAGKDGGPIKVVGYDYANAITALAPRPVDDSDTPGEIQDAGDGSQVGQDDDSG